MLYWCIAKNLVTRKLSENKRKCRPKMLRGLCVWCVDIKEKMVSRKFYLQKGMKYSATKKKIFYYHSRKNALWPILISLQVSTFTVIKKKVLFQLVQTSQAVIKERLIGVRFCRRNINSRKLASTFLCQVSRNREVYKCLLKLFTWAHLLGSLTRDYL